MLQSAFTGCDYSKRCTLARTGSLSEAGLAIKGRLMGRE